MERVKGVLLIDFDSKIPNLALMKISAHFKRLGCAVYLNTPLGDYDEVWLSCIFTWNKDRARQAIAFQEAMGKKVIYGGTGFDWGKLKDRKILPPQIENGLPDYDLYGDDRAIGFAERGCDRKCEFCDVWKKEGKISNYIPLNLWVPADKNKLLLLDNDVAISPHHDQILADSRQTKLKLCITQGYDVRAITEERAAMLAEDKPWDLDFDRRRLYIAWDYIGIEKWVQQGIEMLQGAGFKQSEIYCYMICGFNTTHAQDIYKFYKLKEWGAEPYVMPFNNRKDDKWLNHFARYVNRGYSRFIDLIDYKNGVLVEAIP